MTVRNRNENRNNQKNIFSISNTENLLQKNVTKRQGFETKFKFSPNVTVFKLRNEKAYTTGIMERPLISEEVTEQSECSVRGKHRTLSQSRMMGPADSQKHRATLKDVF